MNNLEISIAIAAAKQRENEARDERKALEATLLGRIGNQLKEEGTTMLPEAGVKVATGWTRKWDHVALSALRPNVRAQFWPFKEEWKEVRAQSKALAVQHPELWEKIEPALTETPKTPAITVLDLVTGAAA